MKVNANFEERVVVHSEQLDWLDSPIAGVQRRLLDRVGSEIARATSIVRYAPGSQFSHHVHTAGEEFLVLDGVFQDEYGDFPAGSYIRNPPASSHTPGTEEGCTIFVKLRQFDLQDDRYIRFNLNDLNGLPESDNPGISSTTLYENIVETVVLLEMAPGATLSRNAPGGAEMLVIEGSVTERGDELGQRSWLRVPVNSKLHVTANEAGAKVWFKTGHLSDVREQIRRALEAGSP